MAYRYTMLKALAGKIHKYSSRSWFVAILILITTIGLIARVYDLGGSPTGFFADEAATGLHAYKLLTTGKDYTGVSHPLFFYSFGFFRNPIPIYFTIPSVWAFGLNEFSVRLPFAIVGTLTIPLVALLVLQLQLFEQSSSNKLCSLLAALFIATSPWHIHFSRFGSENIFLPFFIVLGCTLFLYALQKPVFLSVSFSVFGLGLYTYFPSWLVTPAIVLALTLLYLNQLRKFPMHLLVSICLFTLLALPLVLRLQNGSILARWSQVKTPGSPTTMFAHYLAHFSPNFLFFKGDIDYPGHFITRFSSRGTGELYPFQLPLVLVGLIFLATKVKSQGALLLFFLLLLYPLGGTLANSDGGGAISWRSILGTIPLNIIAALGAVKMIQVIKSLTRIKFAAQTVTILILMAAVFSFENYLWQYHTQYPKYSSDFWGWQYGPREVMNYFLKNREKYDQVILYGSFNSPEIFIKFYDPENTCKGKCSIGDLKDISKGERQLWAVGADKLHEIPFNKTLTTQKILYYPDRSPAFFIGTIN